MSDSKTLIKFDLKDHLTAEELEEYRKQMKKEGAKDMTEHFLNKNVRLPHPKMKLN